MIQVDVSFISSVMEMNLFIKPK